MMLEHKSIMFFALASSRVEVCGGGRSLKRLYLKRKLQCTPYQFNQGKRDRHRELRLRRGVGVFHRAHYFSQLMFQ